MGFYGYAHNKNCNQCRELEFQVISFISRLCFQVVHSFFLNEMLVSLSVQLDHTGLEGPGW